MDELPPHSLVKVVPLAVRVPVTTSPKQANVTVSPLEKLTVPVSVSADGHRIGTLVATAIVPPTATVKPFGNS